MSAKAKPTIKIGDVVFRLDDRTITKTIVLGQKQEPSTRYENKDEIIQSYLIRTDSAGSYNNSDREWVEEKTLYLTLEDAQKKVEEKIQEEIIESYQKISIVDISRKE